MRTQTISAIITLSTITLLGLCIGASPTPHEADDAMERDLVTKLRHGPGVSNHPVGVKPSAAIHIPKGWPLSFDGSITCTTCHEQLPSLVGGSTPFLRQSADSKTKDQSFCANCHSDRAKGVGPKTHWRALRFAHEKPGGSKDRSRAGLLDSASAMCLGCHDGVSAMDAGNKSGGHALMFGLGDRRGSHPIGVHYRASNKRAPGKGTAALKPASLLPREVRLPQGVVSCVSCHDVYNGKPALLTVTTDGSKLCLTCHDMD